MRDQYPLGIFSWFGFVLPFQERLKLIKEAGFAVTSIWWEDEGDPWPVKKESMPQLVRDEGLVLENMHVPYNNSNELWSEHRSVRFEFLQRHIRWLQDCANYHIPMMVMHLTEGVNHPAPNRNGLKSMLELVKAAEELGVMIAIENTRRSDNVPYLLSEIKSNCLGFCFDSSHHFLSDKQDYRLLENFGERLVTTHLSDNDGQDDRHWLPEHGIIDWAMIGKHFPIGYQGCLTLEAYPMAKEREESPSIYLKRAYQKIKNVHDLLAREESTNPI